jgi:hypothetical protein
MPLCTLSSFPTLFTSDGRSTDLQVSQIHTQIWDLVFLFFILLAFQMLILLDVVLTERALLVPIIFLDSLLFAGHLGNNLQLLNPPQRLGM